MLDFLPALLWVSLEWGTRPSPTPCAPPVARKYGLGYRYPQNHPYSMLVMTIMRDFCLNCRSSKSCPAGNRRPDSICKFLFFIPDKSPAVSRSWSWSSRSFGSWRKEVEFRVRSIPLHLWRRNVPRFPVLLLLLLPCSPLVAKNGDGGNASVRYVELDRDTSNHF